MLDEYALSNPLIPTVPTGTDYRQLAGQIRDLARRTRLPIARNELLRLATNYEQRGDHFEEGYRERRSAPDEYPSFFDR